MNEVRRVDLIKAMFDAALAARKNAYVPGCNFPVGACLRGEGGDLFVGVNVENPVTSMSICAETSALGAMVSAGVRHLTNLLIIGGSQHLCPPCGGCRQRLMPFADADTMVHLCTEKGFRESIPLSELLPRYHFSSVGEARQYAPRSASKLHKPPQTGSGRLDSRVVKPRGR